MKENDFVKFSALWQGVALTYSREASETQINMAFEMLREYEFTQISIAAMSHMKNPDSGQFQPKPADIVRHIEGGSKDRGLMAWTKVEGAIRRVGGYDSIVFDDEWIMSIVSDMGGWIKICKTTEDEMPFLKNEFVARYASIIGKKCENYPRRLCGRDEFANSVDYPERVRPPQMFGEEHKCRAIYLSGQSGSTASIKQMDDLTAKASSYLSLVTNLDGKS